MRSLIKLLRWKKEEGSLEEKRRILKTIMSDSDLYDVAAAIRGPDLKCKYDVDLKWMYTVPVRKIANQSVNPIGVVLFHITPEKLEEVLLSLKDIEGKVIHFTNHVAFAFRAFYSLLLIPEDVYNYVLDTIDLITEVAQMGGVITESIRKEYLKVKEKYAKLCEKYIKRDQLLV